MPILFHLIQLPGADFSLFWFTYRDGGARVVTPDLISLFCQIPMQVQYPTFGPFKLPLIGQLMVDCGTLAPIKSNGSYCLL